MGGVIGNVKSFDKKFKFLVQIDGLLSAAFQKCSALEVEAAVIKHHEGGVLTPNKSPGKLDFKAVTLERGATRNEELWLWFKMVAHAAANAGLVDPGFRKNMDIVQQDRSGVTIKRWRCTGCWPSSFTAGEWDNEADEVVIQKVVIEIDDFDRVF